MNNVETVREMIAAGHAMEAAQLAKIVAHALPEAEARALLQVLADAILDPTPRAKNDKPTSLRKRDGRISRDELGFEMGIFCAVSNFVGTQADAFLAVGESYGMSEKNAERIYRKWKKLTTYSAPHLIR